MRVQCLLGAMGAQDPLRAVKGVVSSHSHEGSVHRRAVRVQDPLRAIRILCPPRAMRVQGFLKP